jgi:hypothetical protein
MTLGSITAAGPIPKILLQQVLPQRTEGREKCGRSSIVDGSTTPSAQIIARVPRLATCYCGVFLDRLMSMGFFLNFSLT